MGNHINIAGGRVPQATGGKMKQEAFTPQSFLDTLKSRVILRGIIRQCGGEERCCQYLRTDLTAVACIQTEHKTMSIVEIYYDNSSPSDDYAEGTSVVMNEYHPDHESVRPTPHAQNLETIQLMLNRWALLYGPADSSSGSWLWNRAEFYQFRGKDSFFKELSSHDLHLTVSLAQMKIALATEAVGDRCYLQGVVKALGSIVDAKMRNLERTLNLAIRTPKPR